MSKTVKLKIRTPCLGEGRDLEVDSCWTVAQVKDEIEREWPNHPKPSDQRLIYSGKQLDNQSVLKDALRFHDGWSDHTIHLVCKQLSSNLRHRTNAATPASDPAPEASAPAVETPSQAVDHPWNNYQHQQHSHQIMMHHYYAQYLQYMQYVHSPQHGAGSHVHHPAVNNHHQQQQHLFNPVAAAAAAAAAAVGGPQQLTAHGAAPAPAPNAVPAAPAAVAADNLGAANAGNVMMNAGAGAVGAMEEDDDDLEGGRRDIFDWFYVLSRVLVLFSIVYSYSSLARFALIAGVAIVVYIYKLGFPGQRQEEANNNNQPAPPQQEQQQQQQQEQQQQQQQIQENEGEENAGEEQQEEQTQTPTVADEAATQQAQLAWFDIAVTFVTSFFTSMIPNRNDRQVY